VSHSGPFVVVREPWRIAALCALLAGALACAGGGGAPAAPVAGTGSAWGYLRLVPREGVKVSRPGAGPYGSRRMRDVKLVDYSTPGFAVVYTESGQSPAGSVELEIRTTGVRTQILPEHAAVGVGGTLHVKNSTGAAHVLSIPGLGVIERIEPGKKAELALAKAGEQALFLLDAPRSETRLFVSPGPFTVVGSDGRFELRGLSPGPHELIAWHPRFPPARAAVQVAADGAVRLDLEMGVDHLDDMPDSVPASLP
jgi:hypothetical protein